MARIMILGLGPVLQYELITTARRGRYYLARVVYGLILLVLVWVQFQTWELDHPGGGSIEQVHQFAEETFILFADAQLFTLLCLLPALVAGVIADDHQRKTLHYLLASRLSSAEIVLGKLGARLVHVGTFVALGLPVVSLLALYGGLNPENVLYVYLGTLTTVLAVAGLSMLISVLARRPRDAVLATYALGAIWLLGPPSIEPIAEYCDGSLSWVGPVNNGMLLTNPVMVLGTLTGGGRWGFRPAGFFQSRFSALSWLSPFQTMFCFMVLIQAAAGFVFVGLAIAGLRPLRGTTWPGARPRTGWWTRIAAGARRISRAHVAAPLAHNQILSAPSRRPPCGDDPMLWKERYATMGGGLRWLSSRYAVLFFGVLLGCYLLDVASPALDQLAGGRPSDLSRTEMNVALRGSSTALAVLAMLTVAAASAVSLTGEREQDTWVSLATTLLTPGEIIRAKQFGALWSARRVGLALLVVWAVGIVLGAIHPLGVLAAAAFVFVVAWLIAAVGVFISGRARNSTRSLAWTFIALLIGLGNVPGTLWTALVSYTQVTALWLNHGPLEAVPLALTPFVVVVFIGVTGIYAGVAALLSIWSARRLRATWGEV
jgi:ABC-2 type transporter